jgi:hypothetical protein
VQSATVFSTMSWEALIWVRKSSMAFTVTPSVGVCAGRDYMWYGF